MIAHWYPSMQFSTRIETNACLHHQVGYTKSDSHRDSLELYSFCSWQIWRNPLRPISDCPHRNWGGTQQTSLKANLNFTGPRIAMDFFGTSMQLWDLTTRGHHQAVVHLSSPAFRFLKGQSQVSGLLTSGDNRFTNALMFVLCHAVGLVLAQLWNQHVSAVIEPTWQGFFCL